MVVTVRRDSAIAETMPRRSPPTRVMSEAAIATSVPVPMAMPEVGRGQRRRVVDAVADHGHDVAGGLQLGDPCGLVGGQHLGHHVVDADLLRRRRGRCRRCRR